MRPRGQVESCMEYADGVQGNTASTTAAAAAHLGGRRTRCEQQPWQNMRPHRRQWCRKRTSGLKGLQQPLHSRAQESGIHWGGTQDKMLS